ncbi:MAG: NUDIX hydrolase [Chlorobi bacterium]|nr:NUDIX hydrolase [Chlorobiota bacterium]
MIMLHDGENVFNYRVAGVATHNGKVLVHRGPGDDFWAFPGGRGEMGESAADTLRREMLEELQTSVHVGNLLWLVENFFEYNGQHYHELGLYFAFSFPPDSPLLELEESEFCDELGVKLIFRWQPLDALDQITIVPACLLPRLSALENPMEHLVNRENGAGKSQM